MNYNYKLIRLNLIKGKNTTKKVYIQIKGSKLG